MRTYSGDRTLLMACSICGIPYGYPTEIRYCVDRLFRCNATCTETETPLDYERKQQESRRRIDEIAPAFPMGPRPGWYDT